MNPSTSKSLTPPTLDAGLNAKLSLMMFLQYAIWGAWLPLLWPFLTGHRGLTASQVGDIFAVGALGAIIAPFIAGQIADRYFATEKFLAISHIIGGVLVWQLAEISTYSGLLGFSLAYSIIYSPTLSLTNSLAFHHLPDRDRDFGRVRIWGTVGWIAVGIGIGQWLLHRHTPVDVSAAEMVQKAQFAGMADAFKLSSILGIVMGVFCFFLPATPPAKGKQKSAVGEALGEIKRQPLLTLFLLAVPVSCIHQFYFVHTAPFLGQFQNEAKGFIEAVNKVVGVGGGGLMTIGQMSEMAVLVAIPLFAKRVSRKTLLAVGLIAYALRMFLFANSAAFPEAIRLPAIILGITMHGLCFGCFIFVAFMIVDEETSGDIRASAQSLFNLVTVGIGIIVGSKIAGAVAQWATVDGKLDYAKLFTVPMWAAIACLAVLLIFYPGIKKTPATGG